MRMNFSARHSCAFLFMLSLVIPGISLGHGDEEHGSHDASFGGLVMMYIDLHFEVVIPEDGGVQLYYSDAARSALPAAVVSDVQVEILRADEAPEVVAMAVSSAGDFWSGDSIAVTDPESIVRVAFVFQGEPLVFELPARLFPSFMQQKMEDMPAHHA